MRHSEFIIVLAIGCALSAQSAIGASIKQYTANSIESYQAKTIDSPVKAKTIKTTKAKPMQSFQAKSIDSPVKAKTIKTTKAKPMQSYQGRTIGPERSNQSNEVKLYQGSQARLFTKKDFEKMRRNDAAAGRTHASIGAATGKSSDQPVKGATVYTDPYNTGGWDYNRNQSASPIWNPNRQ
jgi:hypothetical protein